MTTDEAISSNKPQRRDNQEIQATLGTRHRMKTNKKTTTQKTKNISNTDPTKKSGLNPAAHEG